MKKKLTRLFCLSITLIALSGCSSNSELEQLKAENAELKNQIENYNSDDIDVEDIVTENTDEINSLNVNDCIEYTKYMTASTNYYYAVVVYKNISDNVIDVNIDMLFKDESDNIIGVDKDSIYNMYPGKEIALSSMQKDSFADYDLNISVENSDDPTDAVSLEDITADLSRNDNKLIIALTNNTSNETISIINALSLYFKDGQLVDFDSPLVSNIGGIAPGQTTYSESHANVDFDDYKFFYNTYKE